MNIFDHLQTRGLIQDSTNLSDLSLDSKFYTGIDPTSPYLQLGNLLPLIVSIHLSRAGLSPLILFGGATGAIGDPSFKKNERPLLSREEINSNVAKQQSKAREILNRAGVEVEFVNNFDWTKDVSVLDFMRDIGKYLTVNYMLAKDSVKSRLEGGGISYTEFSYMLLQAYDFAHLYETKNCLLQIGGADQWGNMTAGLELIRKKLGGSAYAFSFPLLTNSEGVKFGKSEAGAIWLDESRTTPYQLYQFLLNTKDSDVIKYLHALTFLSSEQIYSLQIENSRSPESRIAHKRLAFEVCKIVHGQDKTIEAIETSESLFGEGDNIDFNNIPSSTIPIQVIDLMDILDLFVVSKLSSSRGEAKRLIKNGGAYLNSVRVQENDVIHIQPNILLRSGKKNYHLIRVQQ